MPLILDKIRNAFNKQSSADNKKETLLKLLAEEDEAVLGQAYICAKTLVEYNVNAGNRWDTVVSQTAALDRAYRRGWYDAMERLKSDRIDN